MLKVITTGLMICLASQAAALSCLRPDVAETFNRVAAAEESYAVFYGFFSTPKQAQPSGNRVSNPQETTFQATFVGQSLTLEGFENTAQRQVTVTQTCAGPWCGSLTGGVQTLAFVEVRDGGLHLTVDPCGSLVFPQPSAAMVRQVENCMQGGDCRRSQPLR